MGSIKKAVITAAGRGTRLFPATRTLQKELFPLVDRDGIAKPVIQIVVEEAVSAGVERVCIVCSPDSEGPLRHHFSPVPETIRQSLSSKPEGIAQADQLDRLASMVEFALQPTPEGYGDAVLCARDFVGDDSFLLLLGDHLYVSKTPETCAATLVRAFPELDGAVSGVARTPIHQLHLFGTVSGDPIPGDPPRYRVREMIEKPKPEVARERLRTPGLREDEFLTFFGMHLLPPRIFDLLAERKARNLREGGEIQLTSSLEVLVRSQNYYAVELPGYRLDMGVPEGLIYTRTVLSARSPYRKILQEVLEEDV